MYRLNCIHLLMQRFDPLSYTIYVYQQDQALLNGYDTHLCNTLAYHAALNLFDAQLLVGGPLSLRAAHSRCIQIYPR